MERIFRICAGAVWVAVFLWSGIPAWSQATASLRGNITDPSGAAIPNATVHLINFATNSDRTTATDQRGSYTFADVIAGTYRLEVEAPGFEKYQQEEIRIQANAQTTLDLKMTINQVQQSITVTGQDVAQCLSARARVLPDVGRGLRVIRRSMSGNYYVLTTPGSTVGVYSPDGKKIGQIPKEASPDSSIVYGTDLQLDSTGHVYVADRGANAIKIYSADGAFVRKIPVLMPISVEPLPDGEVAVAGLLSKRLVEVYDARGEMLRSFGELSDSSDATDTKRLINRGWFYGDSSGNVYFNLAFLTDPTIRKYDSYGYAAYDIDMPSAQSEQNGNANWRVAFKPEVRVAGMGAIGASTSSDSSSGTYGSSSDSASGSIVARVAGGMPMIGGGMHGGGGGFGGGAPGGGEGDHPGGFRRPGVSQVVATMQFTKSADSPESKVQVDALGVDSAEQEVWAAIGGDLVHFDKDGNLAGYYCLSSSDKGPVRPTAILVEPDRILIGTDPFGMFEYVRPDKPPVPADAAAHH
jgi:hypothetical protein